MDSRILVIGETHGNRKHIMAEVELIRNFKPEFILHEGFVDYPRKEIEKRIKDLVNLNQSNELIQEYLPLLRAIKESGAIVEGCDDKTQQALWDDCADITSEDYSQGLDHILEKAERLRKTLKNREKYMVDRIAQYSREGRILVIIGRAHLQRIIKALQEKGIKAESIFLE